MKHPLSMHDTHPSAGGSPRPNRFAQFGNNSCREERRRQAAECLCIPLFRIGLRTRSLDRLESQLQRTFIKAQQLSPTQQDDFGAPAKAVDIATSGYATIYGACLTRFMPLCWPTRQRGVNSEVRDFVSYSVDKLHEYPSSDCGGLRVSTHANISAVFTPFAPPYLLIVFRAP